MSASITTPYTFVPFGPTITAGQLWNHDGVESNPAAAFDQAVPGLLSGFLDLTITTLSGLYIGDAHSSGQSFRWPGPDGRFGIPGASIRGMLRAHIAALTGAALGLGDRDAVTPTLRYPVKLSGTDRAALNQQHMHRQYRGRRSAEANIGRQRVGLLTRSLQGDLEVVETAQFVMNIAGSPRKVPSARWPVVAADLLAGTATGVDARSELARRRGTVVWVVWGEVVVDGVPRPMVIGMGYTSAAAATAAASRAADQRCVDADLRPSQRDRRRPPKQVSFQAWLGNQWTTVAAPVPRAMVLFPTNLPNLDTRGMPKPGDQTPAANCYLIEHPAKRITDAHRPNTQPYNVTGEAEREFRQILGTGRFAFAPMYPTDQQLAGWPDADKTHCFPVFFDLNTRGEVTHLGASNGFAVHTQHDVTQAVANAGGRWERSLHDDPAANDVADSIFGAIGPNHQIRSRVEVGCATASTALTPLTARYAPLFGGHLDSASTRLSAPVGQSSPVSFDDEHASYRGRQFYWHRGTWDGDGQDAWESLVAEHNSTWVADQAEGNAHEREKLSPLPVGALFCSRISFANLSTSELGLLLLALTFAGHHSDTAPTDFAHKLGGGKPLGLGSVILDAQVSLITPERYLRPGRGGIASEVDPLPFIDTYLAAVGWTETDAAADWVHVEETGRAWPPHVAAWLLVHRWRQRPNPGQTRESTVATFSTKVPSRDVFAIAGHPRGTTR